jgi:DNA-binding MurR/RpiR family transcriptional regulator
MKTYNGREARRLESLGRKLTESQRRAAELLALPDVYQMTIEQIAKKVGVSTVTIYRWKRNDDFIAYKNAIADQAMDDFLSEAYDMLRKLARGARTDTNKLKALELALKNRGKLNEVMKVDATLEDKRTQEDIEAEIDEIQKELDKMAEYERDEE